MNSFYSKLVKVYELLNKGVSIDDALDYIYSSFKEFIPYDRIGIALLDFDGMIYSYSLRTENQAFLNAGYSKSILETSLNTVVGSKQPRIINSYSDYLEANPDSEPTKLIIKEGIRSSIAYPLTNNEESIGVILFSSNTPDIYNEEHFKYVKMLSENISIALEKNLLADDLILASITGFAKLVEAKDSDTGLHIERMQNYSKIIAKSLSTANKFKGIVDYKFIDNICKFSPLHDIGKVGIADGILLKPGKLTIAEFEVMKSHTTIGAEILRKANHNAHRKERHFFDMGIEIALGHHEKFNGKGYPTGISGENIPLSSRIVIVADVLDALTSKRVYKNAFDLRSSLQYIKDEAGKMFDPYIVSSMAEMEAEISDIYEKYNENVDLNNI